MSSLVEIFRSDRAKFKHHSEKARSYYAEKNIEKALDHLDKAELARSNLAKHGKLPKKGGKTVKHKNYKKRKTAKKQKQKRSS